MAVAAAPGNCAVRDRRGHSYASEWVQHPPEQDIEDEDDCDVDNRHHYSEGDGVAPGLCDLVARLRHDLDRTDALAVDDDGTSRSRWAARSVRRTTKARACLAWDRSRCRDVHRQRSAGGILHHDPDVTDVVAMARSRSARNFSAGTSCCTEQPLRSRGAAPAPLRLRSRSASSCGSGRSSRGRQESRQQLNEEHDDKELRAHRKAIPERVRRCSRRRPPSHKRHYDFGPRADERTPNGGPSPGSRRTKLPLLRIRYHCGHDTARP